MKLTRFDIRNVIRYIVRIAESDNGGMNMLGRQMAPAIKKIAAIDLTNFLLTIAWSELAIKNAIMKLKAEIFRGKRRGFE